MTRLARFRALPPADRRLVVQAGVSLPLVRVVLRIFGFQRCRRGLMMIASVCARPGAGPPPAHTVPRVARLVRAVALDGMVGRHCLTESLVIWWLLRRLGIESDIRIGVRKDGTRLEAHAWVEWAGLPVEERPDVLHAFASLVRQTVS